MNDLQQDIDQQEAQERRVAVDHLALYVEGRQIETFGKAQKDKAGGVLKAWFQLRPDEELVDGEKNLVARMKPSQHRDAFELARMPKELVLALWKSNALEVNGDVIRALPPENELRDRAMKFSRPGSVSYSLDVKETK